MQEWMTYLRSGQLLRSACDPFIGDSQPVSAKLWPKVSKPQLMFLPDLDVNFARDRLVVVAGNCDAEVVTIYELEEAGLYPHRSPHVETLEHLELDCLHHGSSARVAYREYEMTNL
jgi:hypothetical protein